MPPPGAVRRLGNAVWVIPLADTDSKNSVCESMPKNRPGGPLKTYVGLEPRGIDVARRMPSSKAKRLATLAVLKPTSAATLSGESDSGTRACAYAMTDESGPGRTRSGPTTGAAPTSANFRIEYAPFMPTHSAELSSDSASTLGSEPIGIEAVTAATFG